MTDGWNIIQAIVSMNTETPPHVLDLIADSEWLYWYASGLGSEDIAKTSGVNVDTVLTVLKKYYALSEIRETPLPFNPLKLYKDSYENFQQYVDACKDLGIIDSNLITDSFIMCVFYRRYKKEIDKYERD